MRELPNFDPRLAREEGDWHRAERVLLDLPDIEDELTSQPLTDNSPWVVCMECNHVHQVGAFARCERCGSRQIRLAPSGYSPGGAQ